MQEADRDMEVSFLNTDQFRAKNTQQFHSFFVLAPTQAEDLDIPPVKCGQHTTRKFASRRRCLEKVTL
jgi:hypothetical protein